MKKLISIFCVVAMIFSLAVTVNAAGTSFALTLKEQTATSVTYELYLDTDVNLAGFGICYDMKDAITNKGIADADITVTANTANVTAKYVPNQDLISIKRADTNGSTITGNVKVVTIVINTTNMTGAFDFVQASGSAAKNFAVTEATANGAAEITSTVEFPTATVNPYEAPKTWVTQTPVSAKAGTYKNYEDVVVLTVDVALDEAAEKYGFDLTNGTKTKAFELTGLAGEGSVEYVVAFWGVPSDVTITATPKAYK